MAVSGDGIYVGTELKFAVTVTSPGFSQNDDDWTVTIMRGPKEIVFTKEDLVYDSTEDQWYVCFDSAFFGSGDVYAVVTAYVPDGDFEDGLRTEVTKVLLLKVESI